MGERHLALARRWAARLLVVGIIVVGGVAALAPNASATPIPVGTDLIVNFDFTSPLQSPPPPYVDVLIAFSLSGVLAGETLFVDLFNGLNGTGLIGTGSAPGPLSGPFILSPSNIPGTLDGIFSLGFRLSSGTGDLVGSTATGTAANGAKVTINGRVVPEPATLALLGLGLAGLAVSRRRKLN